MGASLSCCHLGICEANIGDPGACRNPTILAPAGWDVRLWDPDASALAAAPGLIAQSLEDVARHGLAKDPAAAARRIAAAASLEAAVQDVELLVESGPERVKVKV